MMNNISSGRLVANSTSYISVSEAIDLYAAALAQAGSSRAPKIAGVRLEGTITRVNRHPRGRVYLTIADSQRSIEAVAFRREARALPATLRVGQRVSVHGALEWFIDGHRVQIMVQELTILSREDSENAGTSKSSEIGVGAQYSSRSTTDDLILSARRRPIPRLPSTIGIVTSPTAAALEDVLAVIRSRAPWLEPRLAPTPLQGDAAVDGIISAIGKLAHIPCDLILLTRGGGSQDALAPFQNSRVAQAIIDCPVPVICAVGHAEDTTLACRAADARYDTPSGAAHEITRDHVELLAAAQRAVDEVQSTMDSAMDRLREQIASLSAAFTSLSERARSGPVELEVVSD